MKMGPTVCPEKSVNNYHSTLRNIAEELRYHLLRDASLKSHKIWLINITIALHCTVHAQERVHKDTDIWANIHAFLMAAVAGHERLVSRSASFTDHSTAARVDPIVGLVMT